ncbi:MAG TPA: hypothetical protein GXZ82_13095 [Firmicutes bacterium]|jgi:gamma-glutamyltranspeptidase/glutathione hydrolase|nr:hypothetical protein [Bacillota bacterium]
MNGKPSGLVVAPEPLAAQVGNKILTQGGNAVDAAVAAAFAQGVVNPLLCGIGGSGYILVHHAPTGRCVHIDCSCEMGALPPPVDWQTGFLGRSEAFGRYVVAGEANQMGYQSIMTPGFVMGAWEAVRRFGSGRISWAELLAPAVSLAHAGFAVYPFLAENWRSTEDKPGYPALARKLVLCPEAHAIFGRPYQVGEVFVQRDLGRTLSTIANEGAVSFYRGTLAERISAHLTAHNALITKADWAAYQAAEMPVISGYYRGWEIRAAVSGCSSSPQVLSTLQVLAGFPLSSMDPNSPDYIDLLAKAMRAGFLDHLRLKGDPPYSVAARFLQEYTSEERARYWQERIKNGQVNGLACVGGLGGGTTHLSAIDSSGSLVSWTHTIGSCGGAGVITPGLGFLYNNFVGHFYPLPGAWDSILPGKRGGGGAPLLLYKNGKPVMAIGAAGGSRLITAIVQVICNVVDFGMTLQEAVTAPRFHAEETRKLFLEPQIPEQIESTLRARGYETHRTTYMARVHTVMVDEQGAIHSGSDSRSKGGEEPSLT